MTGRSKPELSADMAAELIAEVDASDRRQAGLAIAEGVRAAQGQWIAAHLIAEALVFELIDFVQTNRSGREVAAYLRALAETLETQSSRH